MNERRTVKIERTYDAAPAEVWDMWTTAAGIEAWWGPDGFAVDVHTIDIRPGGKLVYSMKAVAEEMKAVVESQGIPPVTTHEISITEVVPYRRLAYRHPVDFISDVEEYEVGTLLELVPDGAGTRLVLTLDAMHNDEWTDRAVAGWEQELTTMERALKGETT